jgi:ATP/maltotriose-dependent transcriptional regulator MalT
VRSREGVELLATLRERIDDGAYEGAIQLAREIPAGLKLTKKNRLEVNLALGRALAMAGREREAVTELEEVFELASQCEYFEVAADAADWLSWLAWIELDGARARVIAERMMTLAVPASSPEAFRLFVRKATQSIQVGDAPGAAQILAEAEKVSREADIDSFASYLSIKADVLSAQGRSAEALSYARLAADIAARRSDRHLLWRRLLYLGYALHASGRLADAYDAFMAAEGVAREASLTWEPSFARARAAWDALLLGRLDAARERIAECFEEGFEQPWMAVMRAVAGIFIGLACGDDALVARAARLELLDTALASEDAYTLGPAVAAFHAYYLHVGERAKAATLLELGIAKLPSPDCGWAIFPAVARHGSDAAVRRAQMLLDKFPREHRVAEAHREYFSALLAARRGQREESERRAGEAQVLFEDFGCALYAASCLELSGRLTEAHQRYTAIGAFADASRVANARSRRGRPRRSSEASRERREILRLLLAGLTSASVAERLGVSERTIKNRISEIYDFEGVRTRSELLARYKLPDRMA